MWKKRKKAGSQYANDSKTSETQAPCAHRKLEGASKMLHFFNEFSLC